MALGLVFTTGCAIQLPAEFPLSQYTRKQLLGGQEKDEPVVIHPQAEDVLANVLIQEFGPPDDPGMRSAYMSESEYQSVLRGADLYHRHCIHCHGLPGDGNGPTAPFLDPKPRDYRRGVFKWKSTKYNDKPTREDLMRIIGDGAVGTSMPPFRLMPEQERKDLVEYVIFLSTRGELERGILIATVNDGLDDVFKDSSLNLEQQRAKYREDLTIGDRLTEIRNSWASPQVTDPPPSPIPNYEFGSPEYAAALDRGRILYRDKGACFKCHGNDGTAVPHPGNGISPEERAKFFDDWGNPNPPRDLTLGLFRGGRRPIDLWRRIFVGIKGSAMPAGDKLAPQEVWDLVTFVRALPTQKQLLALPPKPTSAHHAAAAGH